MAPRKGLTVKDYADLAAKGYSKTEAARLLGVRIQTVHRVAQAHRLQFAMGYMKKEKRDALAVQAQETTH